MGRARATDGRDSAVGGPSPVVALELLAVDRPPAANPLRPNGKANSMETTDRIALESRATAAAERFHTARRPVVLEFAGVPKAGKTTAVTQVERFLKRCGFRVRTVVERASVCPIRDKKLAAFNVWTACTTLAQVLEQTQPPPKPGDRNGIGAGDIDVLFLDRGLFDAVNWFTVMERFGRISRQERETIEKFLLMDDWVNRISGVVVMTTSAKEALKREKGLLPVTNGKGGSIMNQQVLENVRSTVAETARRLKDRFRICSLDTSSESPQRTVERVASFAVGLIEEQLDEKILSLPSEQLDPLFRGDTTITRSKAETLVQLFTERGEFQSRETVEADEDRVQALPVVVVRNASGHILRLKRRERRRDSALHQQLVIWAGGHVRAEDRENGASMTQCALRELKEELRLSISPRELAIRGAVWVRGADPRAEKNRAKLHVALVYEWQAPTDDVAIALNAAEFYERRGTSLSGSFVEPSELAADIDDNVVIEPWSVEIGGRLLPDVKKHVAKPKLV